MRKKLYGSRIFERILEILPGLFVWSALIAPLLLSYFIPVAVAVFIILFDLMWTFRWFTLSRNLIRGYKELRQTMAHDWLQALRLTEDATRALAEIAVNTTNQGSKGKFSGSKRFREYFQADLEYVKDHPNSVKSWKDIYHMVVLATYKEALAILESSTNGIVNSNYPLDKVVFVLAAEERDHDRATENGNQLKEKYGKLFLDFFVILHPNDENEGKVKGAGISYAAKKVKEEFFDKHGIDLSNVIVSVLDSDTVLHKEFLPYLTFKYIINPNRKFRSFQPIPFFYNNIWDAPAPMRLISTGNSFWQIIESTRPKRLRNFSSHSQSLEALAEVDYWDKFSINDDSRQFWRTYFAFDGNHEVVALFIPVYNDAVLSDTYLKTFKNQYLQLRRWAYGISEFPYVIRHYLLHPNISLGEKWTKTLRLLEGHFSWATAPIFMAVVAWLPLIINPEFKNRALAHELPNITSFILTIGMSGLVITIWLSLLLLPKRPKKYGLFKQIGMVLQWALLPLTTIFLSTLPSIDAHTRLMLGKRLDWYLTEKSRKTKI